MLNSMPANIELLQRVLLWNKKRIKFNVAINPFVLVSIVAAIALVTWIVLFNFFRI